MPAPIKFELRAYPNGGEPMVVSWVEVRHEAAARSKAGLLAKKIDGPVDLAYATDEAWPERYVTTAAPCEFTRSGFRFERLEN